MSTSFLKKIRKDKCLVECASVSSIEEINEKYRNEKTSKDHKKDYNLVSCGQDDNYNELEEIYKSKLEKHVEDEDFTEDEAVRALCETCCELESPRKREDFYKKLSEKLDIEINAEER